MRRFIDYLITEAPITDYKTFGNFDKPSSFRKRDMAMIKSPKAITNAYQKLGKTHHNLNLYFLNSKAGRSFQEVGKVTIDWVRSNLGDEIANYVLTKLDDDAINVIFTNNNGDQGVPMTPWIMAHRIAHALGRNDFSGRPSAQFQEYREAGDCLKTAFNQLLSCYGRGDDTFDDDRYGIYAAHGYLIANNEKQLLFKQIGQQICTFKSARDNNVRTWFEILNELFSQYLITNGVKFNKAPERLKYGRSFLSLKDSKNANEIIETLARDLEYWFNSLLSSATGNILVM